MLVRQLGLRLWKGRKQVAGDGRDKVSRLLHSQGPRHFVAPLSFSLGLTMRLIGIALIGWSVSAGALEPADCAFRLDKQLGGWELPVVDRDVFYGVTRAGGNPFVTTGDFDNDQKKDVAFLIAKDGKKKVAVCLSGKADSVVVISDLYCDDGIARTPQGAKYYNYETGSEGTYGRDGIHAYCYEKAGATYLYKDGAFRRVVDSD